MLNSFSKCRINPRLIVIVVAQKAVLFIEFVIDNTFLNQQDLLAIKCVEFLPKLRYL